MAAEKLKRQAMENVLRYLIQQLRVAAWLNSLSSTFAPANSYSTMPTKSSDAANKRVPQKRVFSSSTLFSHVHLFNNNKRAKVEKSEEGSRMKKGTTTEAAKIIDFEEKKRSSSGMDRFKKMQCSVTLRRLLVHPDGVYFKKGKALRIHDDSKPLMDLESVQSKLRNDLYKKTDQFASDIRTVFRNAMSWYPSRHEVHRTAAKLSDLFETKWKDLEGRWLAEKENKLEKKEKKPNSKPLKLNAGEKRKQLSDSDLSIATAEAKLILEKKKANEATQQNRVCLQRKKQREMMQKMERTIFFDDAFKSFQDLENLCGHSLTHYCTKENSLLKNLTGLVLKEKDF
ncbi:transcription factor GTE11-like [Arachis stenosperma]|uniref:transcription factor GTE11-like n=1 Tax=Arachis stenosperma TaxID=217475 RepID=UPI0025AD89FD|nr:transcription factor GTE11-like [Arachis stenosperma]